MNFSPPSRRALSTLKRYFYTEKDKSVLIGCDANLLEKSEDLIGLVQSNNDRLSRMLRHIFGRCLSVSQKSFLSKVNLRFIPDTSSIESGPEIQPPTRSQNLLFLRKSNTVSQLYYKHNFQRHSTHRSNGMSVSLEQL